MKFSELQLNQKLLSGIDKAGFVDCTPVQEQTFAITLKGRDVCGQSQTGTGKTAAFLISIFQNFLNHEAPKSQQALIIAPTRELADQIGQEAKLIGSGLDFSIGTFYGGVGYETQEKLLKEKVNLIIGTPGRLIDLSNKKKLHFKHIHTLVIDEADRMVDLGFWPDIRKILQHMPSPNKRQSMLFSATLNWRVDKIAWEYMNEPETIEINPEKITIDNISQRLYHVGKNEKINLLLGLLDKEKPESALIFTNMKCTAEKLSKRLKHNGFDCDYLSGDLPQRKRMKIIENLKDGKIKFLVATDVAARGLHINDLELVVNYDLPEHTESYVHRIGRTARAGKSGHAVTLVCEKYCYGLQEIETFIGMQIPVAHAGDELFMKDKSARINLSVRRHKEMKAKPAPKKTKAKPAPQKQVKPEKETPKKPVKPQTEKKRKPEARKKKEPISRELPKTEQERLEYYRKKYGEDFKVTPGKPSQPAPKPTQKPVPKHKPVKKKTLLNKVFGILKKK